MFLQGFHRTVGGLLGDGIVKPWRGIVGVEFLGDGVFLLIERNAFFLIVGLAQVTADEGVVGIEAGGDFDFPAAGFQIALADLGQPNPRRGKGAA